MKTFTQKIQALVVLLFLVSGVFAQEISNLYLVGDAAPNGWNIGDPTPMVQDAANAQLFTWQGVLKAGELKISTFTGDWCDGQWLNAGTPDQGISEATYIVTNGCEGPDNKWRVAEDEAGIYLLSIDLSAETIVFALVSNEVADASLSSITLSEGSLEPAFDPAVKKYTVNLPEGTASVELSATTTDPAATVTGTGIVDLSEGDTSIELVVTGADGTASETYTINFILVKEGEVYANLYLIGDAGPNGWNIGSPEPMEQDANNPLIFTWRGDLKAGEFKFSTFTGDWCDGDWLLATEANQSVLLGEYAYGVYSGCPDGSIDFKWKVQAGEEGEYEILVDLEQERISIASKVSVNQMENINTMHIYPNPANKVVRITLNEEADRFELFDQRGRSLWHRNETTSTLNLELTHFQPGIYLLMANTLLGEIVTSRLVISK